MNQLKLKEVTGALSNDTITVLPEISTAEYYRMTAQLRLMEIQRLNKALRKRSKQVSGLRIKINKLEGRKK